MTRLAAGVLITFELTSKGHHPHVPELSCSYVQHGWSAMADAACWTCSAFMTLG